MSPWVIKVPIMLVKSSGAEVAGMKNKRKTLRER